MPLVNPSALTHLPFTEIVWPERLPSVILGNAAYPETLKAPDSWSTRRIALALPTPWS
jgi:hypothetical protein